MAGGARCEDGPMSAESAPKPVVIRISPIAHLAVGFLTLSLLAVVSAAPGWVSIVLVIPVLLSLAIVRYRTIADGETVTARTLTGSRSVTWEQIDGLAFEKSKWASAHLKDGERLMLPAVTFASLPLLTAASGGRVPNPYDR